MCLKATIHLHAILYIHLLVSKHTLLVLNCYYSGPCNAGLPNCVKAFSHYILHRTLVIWSCYYPIPPLIAKDQKATEFMLCIE